MSKGGLIPGLIHTIIMSTNPIDREYVFYDGIYIDENIKNVGTHIMNAFRDYGIKYVSLKRNVIVEGRSWEMSAAMALLNKDGVYSGVVDMYEPPRRFSFGAVPAIDTKRKLSRKLITHIELPRV
uniref:Uncharacterized protein n=1 Tax=viral metagenome TaxID=1070528 RepID=A0A2V0R9H0_9ZZZZ